MVDRLLHVVNLEDLAAGSGYQVCKLAQRLRISTRQLERYFAVQFESTPRAWLLKVRIRRAQELLSQGESVKSVSIKLGYSNCSLFCRTFKRETGQTASDYCKSIENLFQSTHCLQIRRNRHERKLAARGEGDQN